MLPAEQSCPDIAFKRARWRAHQGNIDLRRLVFIDETWIKTTMAPLRGWGLRGQRLDARVPRGHWKTLAFVAALRHDRADAPCVIGGPINDDLFAAYVEQVLAPTLRPGGIAILDTLSAATREAARAAPFATPARSSTSPAQPSAPTASQTQAMLPCKDRML